MAGKETVSVAAMRSPTSGREADERMETINPEIEKRLLRKLDFKMMPILWFLFLVSFIDRGNIGEWNVGVADGSPVDPAYTYAWA